MGGPGKECGTNKLPPMAGIWERSKRGKRRHQSTCLPASQRILLGGIHLIEWSCATRGPESE